MLLALSPIGELGTLLGGIASTIVAVIATVKWYSSRTKSQVIQAVDQVLDLRIAELLKSMMVTRANRAGHDRTRVVDIAFVAPDISLRLPVIMDEWLSVLPGCDIMGDQFTDEKTTYWLRADSATRIKRHTHVGSESVTVIRGSMMDYLTGREYGPGETWVIEAGVVHSVLFEAPEDSHGLFLIEVRPPLKSTAQESLQLDGLASLSPI